jgi:hypothetical protein
MARSYKRDKSGRFSGGGGGGGGKKATGAPKSKSAATRAANKATTDRLTSQGLTGTGSRLRTKNAALYQGTKKTKSNNEQLWRGKEFNQRNGALGEKMGAQRSKAKVGGTIRKRK